MINQISEIDSEIKRNEESRHDYANAYIPDWVMPGSRKFEALIFGDEVLAEPENRESIGAMQSLAFAREISSYDKQLNLLKRLTSNGYRD